MAVKTFAAGDVLTASDTNAYLANAGFNVITPTSVTNGTLSGAKITVNSTVGSVTVGGAFSATYENYFIQYYGYGSSADSVLWMTINGSTGATYQSAGFYMAYGSATVNGSGGAATASGFRLAESASAGNNSIGVFLYRPYLATNTTFQSSSQNNTYMNQYSGKDTNAASSTNFTLTPSSGTISGGTIMVYGIRLG